MDDKAAKPSCRIVEILLDERSIARASPEIEHERAVAVFDLIEKNRFAPEGHDGGPYKLRLALVEQRLVLEITTADGDLVATHLLSLTPFRKIVKDYFLICESYFAAIRSASPAQIEAIDMGRRGVHNEGAQVLMERLAGKIEIDDDTARRLFTLICALHWKG